MKITADSFVLMPWIISTIFLARPKSHNFKSPYSLIKTFDGLFCIKITFISFFTLNHNRWFHGNADKKGLAVNLFQMIWRHFLESFVKNMKFLYFLSFYYKFILFDQLHEIPSRTIFKNNPQMISRFVPIVEFQYIELVQIIQNFHL